MGDQNGSISPGSLCRLFCCPPIPSRVAAKLAFMPPPPSYNIIADAADSKTYEVVLGNDAEWQFSDAEKARLEVFYANTSKSNRIACMYVNCTDTPKYYILFSHGNAVDIGQMSSFYLSLGSNLQCNILAYDYSGYGRSTGSPSERNLYADVDAAYRELQHRYNVESSQILLYGQSIGTVPTVDLASRTSPNVKGVVLHSPLMSGMRVAFPQTKRTWCFDAFPSIEKVHRIKSKVLVIHGIHDEVIDFSHGEAIYQRCPVKVNPLWVHRGHNDIEVDEMYLRRLQEFVQVELSDSAVMAAIPNAISIENTSGTIPNDGITTPNGIRLDAASTSS